MTRMKGYGDLEDLHYSQYIRGAQHYEVFHFEGSFAMRASTAPAHQS